MKKVLTIVLLMLCSACDMSRLGRKEGAIDEEKWLYVIHARNAYLTQTELVLEEPGAHVLAFTDRPFRKTAMVPCAEFAAGWSHAFPSNPNATMAYSDVDHHYHSEVLELMRPRMEGDTLIFQMKILEGEAPLEEDFGETALFIDAGGFVIYPYGIGAAAVSGSYRSAEEGDGNIDSIWVK